MPNRELKTSCNKEYAVCMVMNEIPESVESVSHICIPTLLNGHLVDVFTEHQQERCLKRWREVASSDGGELPQAISMDARDPNRA